jgi:prepilin-type N-terminal cleavage/methylation domain-containing protein
MEILMRFTSHSKFSVQEKGFTLIELLIVIAIILILIAIALPNFLEAQTRSKITRNSAEMRGLALALESYRTDFPRYPPQSFYEPTQFAPLPTVTCNVCSLFSLTTPIPYMTSVPRDLFAPEGDSIYNDSTDSEVPLHPVDNEHGMSYLYWSQESLRFNRQTATADAMKVNGINYTLLGVGPDRDLDTINLGSANFAGARTNNVPWAYSPTNGTKSSGDVLRTQP